MQNIIQFKIKTLSNLFIGGAPVAFEIGGIDQQTVVDLAGFPCLPGSSLKGTLRAIIRDDTSAKKLEIADLYTKYLQDKEQQIVLRHEDVKRIRERYHEVQEKLSAEYLFGIEGFNNTPKLLFSDVSIKANDYNIKDCFSIDMKNSIDMQDGKPVSNPRTYKAARSGLLFQGEIRLYKIALLGENAVTLCKEYVQEQLLKFNEGIYRLGNSKSRGYGKISVMLEEGGSDIEKLSN
ncbi:RAMP superfamily CRISPR-associated protein [Anaerosinus massiliensis]|uniref:RAMP superfamily CRISPR-associated protein n=1 Tax=Massilibacillus massiliensis TaxID=1806837 RepID=UPI000A9E0EE6|nr:RAMP superfamily CRISPR-associated protein [Massilibacillus massiliensis]